MSPTASSQAPLRGWTLAAFMRNARGFTLAELAIVMAVLATLAAALAPAAVREAELRLARRVAREMALIQDAARWHYHDRRAWPADLGALQAAGYLPAGWTPLTPWGDPYTLAATPPAVTVSALLPDGVAGAAAALTLMPVVQPAGGGRARLESTAPRPGRLASASMLVRRAGDTMTGPLMLENTGVGWQRDGVSRWGLGTGAGGTLGLADDAGQARVTIDPAGGTTGLTALSTPAASLASLSGATATWTGDLSGWDLWIGAIGHWMSQAQYP